MIYYIMHCWEVMEQRAGPHWREWIRAVWPWGHVTLFQPLLCFFPSCFLNALKWACFLCHYVPRLDSSNHRLKLLKPWVNISFSFVLTFSSTLCEKSNETQWQITLASQLELMAPSLGSCMHFLCLYRTLCLPCSIRTKLDYKFFLKCKIF